MLIDATLKETFPPISLPKREYMENSRKIWEELGLPKLRPEMPWYGYDLGEWNEHLERQAQLAVKSDYWQTGEWCRQRRRSDVADEHRDAHARRRAGLRRRAEEAAVAAAPPVGPTNRRRGISVWPSRASLRTYTCSGTASSMFRSRAASALVKNVSSLLATSTHRAPPGT